LRTFSLSDIPLDATGLSVFHLFSSAAISLGKAMDTLLGGLPSPKMAFASSIDELLPTVFRLRPHHVVSRGDVSPVDRGPTARSWLFIVFLACGSRHLAHIDLTLSFPLQLSYLFASGPI